MRIITNKVTKMKKVYALETRVYKTIGDRTEALHWNKMYRSKKKVLAELHDYSHIGTLWEKDADDGDNKLFFDPTPSQKARGIHWVKKEVFELELF